MLVRNEPLMPTKELYKNKTCLYRSREEIFLQVQENRNQNVMCNSPIATSNFVVHQFDFAVYDVSGRPIKHLTD